jgi:hypothetical protein
LGIAARWLWNVLNGVATAKSGVTMERMDVQRHWIVKLCQGYAPKRVQSIARDTQWIARAKQG